MIFTTWYSCGRLSGRPGCNSFSKTGAVWHQLLADTSNRSALFPGSAGALARRAAGVNGMGAPPLRRLTLDTKV
jgi:hypothetical protein